jgi:hypothetical protein
LSFKIKATSIKSMEENINWLEELIIRESTPKIMRSGTVVEFCEKYGITESNYYYQASKTENQKEILKTCLNSVKKSAPEVLEKLKEKAISGNDKSIEMFLDYVLELSKNLDIKTDGEKIGLSLVSPEQIDELLKRRTKTDSAGGQT